MNNVMLAAQVDLDAIDAGAARAGIYWPRSLFDTLTVVKTGLFKLETAESAQLVTALFPLSSNHVKIRN